nr:viral A-type inclusion protein [Haemonchus contortus]
MEIMKSAAVTLGDAPSTSRCSECDGRMMEVTRLQNEINDAKDQVRRLLDDIGDLSGKLDEEEAVAFEKDETIKSLQLALNVETEARNALDSDLRAKEEECLSLLNSLETLSTSAKEKSEEHRLEMEQMRAELSENTEELKKSQEMISQLTKARTAAEEITISLQETASSLSEQLNQAITERENAIAEKEKAEALSEEWKAKHVELKMELDNVVINNEATRKMEVDRLTVENEHLTDKLHNLETEHERAVADLTAMQESHNQFVEVLTKKVDHFKEEKAEWLLERESMTAEIASLKEEAEARKEAESEKSTLESYVENLTKEVSELSMKENEQKESVNRLTSQLEELGKEKDKLSEERESLLHDMASLQSKLSAQSELFEQQKITADSRIEELTKEEHLKNHSEPIAQCASVKYFEKLDEEEEEDYRDEGDNIIDRNARKMVLKSRSFPSFP